MTYMPCSPRPPSISRCGNPGCYSKQAGSPGQDITLSGRSEFAFRTSLGAKSTRWPACCRCPPIGLPACTVRQQETRLWPMCAPEFSGRSSSNLGLWRHSATTRWQDE